MGCSYASETEDKVEEPKKNNKRKQRESKRISLTTPHNKHIYKLRNPLCNILVYTKTEKEKEIPDVSSLNNSQEETTLKLNIRKHPKKIKENNIEYDNDAIIADNSELHGIIFDSSVKDIEQVDLTKEAAVQMVRTAVVESRNIKHKVSVDISDKQIKIIGRIIYDVLYDIDKYDISKPITHPELNYVLIKIALKPLSNENLHNNCYKHKNITYKELKHAVKNVEKGSEVKGIKVLTIQIC